MLWHLEQYSACMCKYPYSGCLLLMTPTFNVALFFFIELVCQTSR